MDVRGSLWELLWHQSLAPKNIAPPLSHERARCAGMLVTGHLDRPQILTGNADKCVGSVLTPFGEQRAGFRGKIIVGHKMGEPSEACIACGRPEMTLKIDTGEGSCRQPCTSDLLVQSCAHVYVDRICF